MKCNYKSAEWYGEKHLEPDDLYKNKSPSILALKRPGLTIYICGNNLWWCLEIKIY
jgi:hypothetical protein